MKLFLIFGILLVAALNCTAAAADYNEAIAEIKEAFPELAIGAPEVIEVVFDNGAFVDLGTTITPTESKNRPFVNWNAEKNTFYTLMIMDPDAPSKQDPYMRDVVAWMRVNIPGNNVDKGEDLFEYLGAATPPNVGFNRYFYFLFAQPQKLEFNEKRVTDKEIDGRLYFRTRNFIEKYQLGGPVGVNYLKAYFDPQSLVVYKQVGCCEDLY